MQAYGMASVDDQEIDVGSVMLLPGIEISFLASFSSALPLSF